jgi:putative glutamine amidotransferase
MTEASSTTTQPMGREGLNQKCSRRIGVSMRVTRAEGYDEPRDSLAHDWIDFFERHFPDLDWIPLPNAGEGAKSFIARWNLSGILLSGGNDIGQSPRRDQTEHALLEAAMEQSLPVFGVCRGLQFLQHYFGGPLLRCDASQHVNRNHPVTLVRDLAGMPSGARLMVNSFHHFGVGAEQMALGLVPLAVSDDGFVEALQHESHPVLGVQWHPERPSPSSQLDIALINHWLGMM